MGWLFGKTKPDVEPIETAKEPIEHHPTNYLRWVKRYKTDGQKEWIESVLQQLWRYGPGGYGHSNWRDVPVTTEDDWMNDDSSDPLRTDLSSLLESSKGS